MINYFNVGLFKNLKLPSKQTHCSGGLSDAAHPGHFLSPPAESVEQVLSGQGAEGDDQAGRAEDVSVAGAPYCLTPPLLNSLVEFFYFFSSRQDSQRFATSRMTTCAPN